MYLESKMDPSTEALYKCIETIIGMETTTGLEIQAEMVKMPPLAEWD